MILCVARISNILAIMTLTPHNTFQKEFINILWWSEVISDGWPKCTRDLSKNICVTYCTQKVLYNMLMCLYDGWSKPYMFIIKTIQQMKHIVIYCLILSISLNMRHNTPIY
jgi:hypothetical protein